jgi:hypothetical protein
MCHSSSNRCGNLIPSQRFAQPRCSRPPGRRVSGSPRHNPCRWNAVRYAIGSTAKTLRFCLIVFVMVIPPVVLVVLAHRTVGAV